MTKVAADITQSCYATNPPFHPDAAYPELPHMDTSPQANPAFALLRNLLRQLGCDAEHFGAAAWNPLQPWVRPGQTVVIKPNFVLSSNYGGGDLFAVITHPSLLRAIVDYVFIALRGEGRIIIADAPQMDCNWSRLMAAIRLDAIQEFYSQRHRFNVEVLDLRPFELMDPGKPAYSTNRRPLPGDPQGSVTINLGARSAFHGLPSKQFYGADYNRAETIARHHDETHEYVISRTVLAADTFISVPKMKVHKKVGVTLNLKGLVGINTNKNCLVHYRLGTPSRGGDQFPENQAATDRGLIRIQRWFFDRALARQTRFGDLLYRSALAAYRALVKPILPVSESMTETDAGNWHGNDTAWRMTTDLARIIYFADAHGIIRDTPQRRMFSVVDGIIGGELRGPLAPTALHAGCLVAGDDLLAVDLVATRLMGFDVNRLKMFDLKNSNDWKFGPDFFPRLEIFIRGARVSAEVFFDAAWQSPLPAFKPHPGWTGHIEVKP